MNSLLKGSSMRQLSRFHRTFGRVVIAMGTVFLLLLLSRQYVSAQGGKIQVTGVVRDAQTNDPLPGVSVLEGTGSSAKGVGLTEDDGKFTVTVSDGATLTFRIVGYGEYTAKARAGKSINVRLSVTQNKLKEAVIVGYQTKTRELTTGAAVIVSGKDLQDVPVSSVEQLLQGRVAGLNVQNNTGVPGGRGSVAVRGLSNITVQGSGSNAFLNPTSPLYVIDGVPVDADANFSYGFQSAGPGVSPLSLIPPEDIQSLEVLKDAAATALYGSRGAYGVIVITTKQGSSKIPLVKYTTNFFINEVPKLRATIGGNLERQLRIKEIMQNGTYNDILSISTTPFLSDSLNPYYNNSTNWQGIFYRTTYNTTHDINISGGDPAFNYKADASYYHENGIIRNTGFDRYTINTTMQYQPSPKLRVFTTLNTQLANRNLGSGNGLLQSGVADNGKSSSLLPGPDYFAASSSTLAALEVANNNKTLNTRASIDASYQLIDGLSLATSISYEYQSNTQDKFTPAAANNDYSQIYGYDDRNFTLYNRNTITYFKSFNKAHNFTVTVFNELYNKGLQAHVIQQEKTPNDQYEGPLGYSGQTSLGGGLLDNYTSVHQASFAGLFSYNYKQKYVLDLTYRLDGTSVSGFKDPYTRNPTVAFRWNFNKENIFTDSKWLTYGSLRGSWGQNITPNGNIFDIYGTYRPHNTYNGNSRVGSNFDQLPNPYLQPAVNNQYDLGFEAGFFDDRIDVIFDTYYANKKHLLRSKDLADITGFNKVMTDETSLVDYGYELTLTFHPLPPSSPVNWSVSVNGALNYDVLTHLPDGARQLIDVDASTGQNILHQVGRNALDNYLLNTLGIFASTADVPVDPATGLRYRTSGGTYFQGGDPYWQDVDGNYILNNSDYTPAGNPEPLLTGGLQSYLTYKGFSVNINATYTAIRDILNNTLAERLAFISDPFNPKTIVDFNQLNYWKQSGSNATYSNPFDFTRASAVNPYRPDQTLFQEDGTYFKLNTVTVGYMLNQNFTQRYGMSQVRFYLTCNNVKTFSTYSGPNPENVSDIGRDQSDGYPVARQWSFGLNVEF